MELGFRAHSALTASSGRELRLGCASANDLPENETSADDYNPWIEFSDTITFSQNGNWMSVDDFEWPSPNDAPNEDVDYVHSSTVDEEDFYEIQDGDA